MSPSDPTERHCPDLLAPAVHAETIGTYLSQHPGNHIPSEHELPQLRNLLDEADEELACFDAELQQLMKKLEDKRSRMSSAIHRLRVMVKPSIHHLPPEILSLVFKVCWDEVKEKDKFWSSQSQTRVQSLALTLSRVCSRWRAIAFSLPRVWSSINLDLHCDCGTSGVGKMLNFMKFSLEKSINHPLLLSISFPGVFRSRIHVPLVREAIRHSHRWKQLDFDMPDPEGLLDSPDALPILESLKIKTWPFGWSVFHDHPVSSPHLRILQLNGVGDIGLDLTSLNHLTLGSCRVPVVFDILRSCNGLTRLTFSQHDDDELIPLEPRLHITSSLELLEVVGLCHDADVFFQCLTLPRLQHLILSEGTILFPDAVFRQFLIRSRPPLTTLKVSGYSMEAYRFIEMLTLVPSIETLLIQNPSPFDDLDPIIDASFLDRLTFPHKYQLQQYEDSVLLPTLADLTLDFEEHRFSKERLLTMVQSRCLQEHWMGDVTGWKQLRVFNLKCSARDLDVYYRLCLEDLRMSGLKLTFEFSGIESEE